MVLTQEVGQVKNLVRVFFYFQLEEGHVEFIKRKELHAHFIAVIVYIIIQFSSSICYLNGTCFNLALEHGLDDLLNRYFDPFFSLLLIFVLILCANPGQTI